jgi:anhydro-N-acetylmuramic acid kinase
MISLPLPLDSEVLAVGLMSGTSADGIDAALVRLRGAGDATRSETLALRSSAFAPELRSQILACMDGHVSEVCELNVLLAEEYAAAALAIIAEAGADKESVAFIACHGQTVYHIPRGSSRACSSLQIGDGNTIATRTGIVTVSDFRPADIAAGGEGAPLVPFFDRLMFLKPGVRRVLLNIGGVGNITLVAEGEPPLAFDTGPGNAPLDLVAAAIDPSLSCDEGGLLAAKGTIDEFLLGRLLQHSYFSATPPKSTGRELFGKDYVDVLLAGYPPDHRIDLLATLTALTARSIARAIHEFLPNGDQIDEVLASGGGVHNSTLMEQLRSALGSTRLRRTEEVGVPVDSKEAIAFAVLGNQLLHGLPGNLPESTGARHPALLGKISLPPL